MSTCSLLKAFTFSIGVAFLLATASHSNEGLLPTGDVREGLPSSATPSNPYSDDPKDLLNQLHHILFVETLIPEEVQAALPTERKKNSLSDAEFYVSGWYFKKRPGSEEDRQTYGGDVRVSPRRTIDSQARELLLPILEKLATAEKLEAFPLLQQPLARLMVQWDLMSLWWHLERMKSEDLVLLESMARTIAALSQTAETLKGLPSGIGELEKNHVKPQPPSTTEPYYPIDFVFDKSANGPWVEVGRKSSTLFRADRTLRSSRVYLKSGTREETVSLIANAADYSSGKKIVPHETMTILIQQMMGIDSDLNPVATAVVDEFRVRIMSEPTDLRHDSSTSSRDGSSHWIFMRTRYGSMRDNAADFRFVPDTAQSLFLEYGTQKHATFAAQCALCHRRSETGGKNNSGVRILEPVARPHIAEPSERLSLAEKEMAPIVARLKERLNKKTLTENEVSKTPKSSQLAATDPPVTANSQNQSPASSQEELVAGSVKEPVKLKPRADRTIDERNQWAVELRKLYVKDSSQWPAPTVDQEVKWQELGRLPEVIHPRNNQYSIAKEKLGQTLFFDPRLSGSGQIACASCHDPDLGWADGRTTSFGHSRKMLSRNAPSIRNSGHFKTLFWDGRAVSLEDQAEKVLTNPDEMRSSEDHLVTVLQQIPGYKLLFRNAFGEESVSMQRVTQAIACFERTIVGGSSRFDAFVKGKTSNFTDAELIGLDLFRREARCMNCHNGPLFSDNDFHDIGLSNFGRRFEDLGRYSFTKNPVDSGKFRTPSLRHVTKTLPLMHNGLFELPVALNLYNAGMPVIKRREADKNVMHFPNKSSRVKPLGLNKQDLSDLAAFLTTLEEPHRRIEPPSLPEFDSAK
jgi:cytochrome c peroxidase/cytochrome c553